jgi:hypothetical protein
VRPGLSPPRMGNLRGGEVRALERMGTQRVDSATRGFIPPLQYKKGRPLCRPRICLSVQKERFGGTSPKTATASPATAQTTVAPTTMASPSTTAAQNRSAWPRRARTDPELAGAANGAGTWEQRVNVLGKSRIIGHPPAQKSKNAPRRGASHREAHMSASVGVTDAPPPAS